MKRLFVPVAFSLLLLDGGWLSTAGTEDPIGRRARQLHFSSLVLDTHIDTTLRLTRPDWKFSAEHAPMPAEVASQPESQSQEGHADLPRIRKGGLGALFFGIVVRGTVTGPKAVNDALLQIDAVHKLADDFSQQVAFCTTADQVRDAHRQGKIAALIGMEGGHMINNSLAILRMYGKLGVRYITLTHFYNTDWADSSGEQPQHNGLTPFGRSIVAEMNRQGIMVDISHVSDKTFWDTLETSKTPLIASHSSCRAIANHVRNMTDEMIRALAAKGGVIQINYNSPYLDNDRC
ncbi:MAG TPA: membrane dipeptidase, partial [Acidobacteriota bacterium]